MLHLESVGVKPLDGLPDGGAGVGLLCLVHAGKLEQTTEPTYVLGP
jgi:hypothetical protein